MKTLLLLRHAKAAWDAPVNDHERSLSGKGRRDAFAAGELLAARDLHPDVVACSTATRTRETWARAVKGGARCADVRYLDEIYNAHVTELAQIVRALPETAETALLLGHGPAIPELVEFLAVRVAGAPGWARLDHKFPTAGLAILSLPGPWAAAGETRAELVAFEVPRGKEPATEPAEPTGD